MGPASFKNAETEIHPLKSSDDKMATFPLTHRTFGNRNLISLWVQELQIVALCAPSYFTDPEVRVLTFSCTVYENVKSTFLNLYVHCDMTTGNNAMQIFACF